MLSNIDAPTGFFSNDVDENETVSPTTNLSVPEISLQISAPLVKPPSTSKFSFSKFGSAKITKPPIQKTESNNEPVIESVNKDKDKNKDYGYLKYNGLKIKYLYNKKNKLRLDRNMNVTSDFNTLLQQREATRDIKKSEKEIESINDSSNMFVETDGVLKDSFVEGIKKDAMLDKADEHLGKLSRNLFISKVDKAIKNGILPKVFFGSIEELFLYMNPEERGRMIINMIFGGLISRSKLTGPGGKSASKEFTKITDALVNLKTGGSNDKFGRIYNKTLEYIISNGTRYRMDLFAAEQVTNVAKFINKIAELNLPVFFPSNLLFSDPIVNKDVPTKSVPLSGTPTLDNLSEFFGSGKQITQKAQASIENAKKAADEKNKADKRKGNVGKSVDMEDMFF